MKYRVTIDFRKGPSFSTEVTANNTNQAVIAAAQLALECGFKGFPKTYKTVELEGAHAQAS